MEQAFTLYKFRTLDERGELTNWSRFLRPASLAFSNENEILANQPYPANYYRQTILPLKIELDKAYVQRRDLKFYFSLILQTLGKVFSGKK